MVQKNLEIYKCQLCGNIVEVIHTGGGTLVCCGQEMVQLVENTTDAAQEKHVPVIEKTADGVKVSVGSVMHPMQAEHYIEWVQIIADGKACRHFFKPGDEPAAYFGISPDEVTAREFCNLHGLWKA